MDFAIADRYDISYDLVWFNRQAFEADFNSSSFEMESKTTDDVWLELKEELRLDRNDLQHDQRNSLSSPSTVPVTSSESASSPDVDEEQLMEVDDLLSVFTPGPYKFITLPPIISPLPTTPVFSFQSHQVRVPSPSTPLCNRIPSTSTDGGYGSDEDFDDVTSSPTSRPTPNQTWYPQRPHRSRPSCARQLFPDSRDD
ncbi:uncharacterized protein [Amphiura filiformis]|uniref:uncharacterized protein isoform X1 n=1 Tax=Amphiura filiformis TaxID=82378 RepID=UPI003B210BC6